MGEPPKPVREARHGRGNDSQRREGGRGDQNRRNGKGRGGERDAAEARETARPESAAGEAAGEQREDRRRGRGGRDRQRDERRPSEATEVSAAESTPRPPRGEGRGARRPEAASDATVEAPAALALTAGGDFADTQPQSTEEGSGAEGGRRRRRRGRRERDEGMAPVEAEGVEAGDGVAAEGASEPVENAVEGEGRRRRRGRGERRRDEEGALVDQPSSESPAFEGAAPALAAAVVAVQPDMQPAMQAEPTTAVTQAPVDDVPAVVSPPAEERAQALPAAEPARFELPAQALTDLAQAAGLEWVQSDVQKVAQVQAAIAAEPKPVHVPRELPRIVLPDEGPLVLVETRRDLADLKLPFEQTAG